MPLGQAVNVGAQCLDDETLALLLDGSLDVNEDAVVRAHLDTCDACRRLFAEAARSSDSGADPKPALLMQSRIIAYDQLVEGDIVAGKYRLERLLGSGGMGNVVAARHVELNQLVALKVIRPEMMNDADAVKRFAREAKAAAALKSEHAVRIFDVGRLDSGMPYMVMEYLEGHDLASPLEQSGPLPVGDALAYVLQACEAIGEAHDLGIVHRDIKPHNLFLTRGRGGEPFVKVLDFGLAKALSNNMDSAMTGTNVMLGSPFFMSPEQVSSTRDVDRRTDIWSLGATLYYIIAGTPPFVAPNVHLVCQRVLSEDFPPIKKHRAGVPEAVEKLVRRCMNRDPKGRFGTIPELEAALRRAIDITVNVDSTTNVRASPKWVHEDDTDAETMTVVPVQGTARTVETLAVRTRPLSESARGMSPAMPPMRVAPPPPPPSPSPYLQRPSSGPMFTPGAPLPSHPSMPQHPGSSFPPRGHSSIPPPRGIAVASASASADVPAIPTPTRDDLAPISSSARLSIILGAIAVLAVGATILGFQFYRLRMTRSPSTSPTATDVRPADSNLAATPPTTTSGDAPPPTAKGNEDRGPRNNVPHNIGPRPRIGTARPPASTNVDPYDHP